MLRAWCVRQSSGEAWVGALAEASPALWRSRSPNPELRAVVLTPQAAVHY